MEGSDDDADATDDAVDESSSDDEAAENDAVVVRWGKKEYDAVVLEEVARCAVLGAVDKNNVRVAGAGAVRRCRRRGERATWLAAGGQGGGGRPAAGGVARGDAGGRAAGLGRCATVAAPQEERRRPVGTLRARAQARHGWARAGRRGTGCRAGRRAGAEARRGAARAAPSEARRAGADDVAFGVQAGAAPAAEAPPPAAAEASGEAEGEALEAAEEEASGAAEAEADGDESESEEEFGENDAVVVRWGKKEYDAVVLEVKSRAAKPLLVQFDKDNACAWLAPGAVRLMPEAEASALPGWLRVGKAVEAVDPLAAAGGVARRDAGGRAARVGGGRRRRATVAALQEERRRPVGTPRARAQPGTAAPAPAAAEEEEEAGGAAPAPAHQPRRAKRSAKLVTRAAELVRLSRDAARGLRGVGAASRRAARRRRVRRVVWRRRGHRR